MDFHLCWLRQALWNAFYSVFIIFQSSLPCLNKIQEIQSIFFIASASTVPDAFVRDVHMLQHNKIQIGISGLSSRISPSYIFCKFSYSISFCFCVRPIQQNSLHSIHIISHSVYIVKYNFSRMNKSFHFLFLQSLHPVRCDMFAVDTPRREIGREPEWNLQLRNQINLNQTVGSIDASWKIDFDSPLALQPFKFNPSISTRFPLGTSYLYDQFFARYTVGEIFWTWWFWICAHCLSHRWGQNERKLFYSTGCDWGRGKRMIKPNNNFLSLLIEFHDKTCWHKITFPRLFTHTHTFSTRNDLDCSRELWVMG